MHAALKNPKTTVVAMVNNAYMARPGDFGMASYIEGSNILLKSHPNVALVSLDIAAENARAIGNRGLVQVHYWDREALQEGTIASPLVKAVYDRGGKSDTGPFDAAAHRAILEALTDVQIPLLNDLSIRDVCASKWASTDVFNDAGVRTPHTEIYSHDGLMALLSSGMVFIKENSSFGASGHFTILPDNGHFQVKSTDNGNETMLFKNAEDAIRFIESQMSGEYIIQNGIAINRHEGRPQSLRIMLQRNESGEFNAPITFAYLGSKGGEQSNFGGAGEVDTSDPNHTLDNFKAIEGQIATSSTKLLKSLERKAGGTAGQIGIDAVVDQKGGVWYLEMNSKPGARQFRKLASLSEQWDKNVELLLSTPLEYLVYLGRGSIKQK